MIFRKIIRILVISTCLIVAAYCIIVQLHYSESLFVLEQESFVEVITENALSLFSIFILTALLIYALNKWKAFPFGKYIAVFIFFPFAVYNAFLIIFFMIESVPLFIRSMGPGGGLGEYAMFMGSLIYFAMSAIISVTTVVQARWLFNK